MSTNTSLRLILFATLVVAATGTAWAEPPNYWEGAVSRKGSIQLIQVQFDRTDSAISGVYSIPELALYKEPLEDIEEHDNRLSFRMLYGVFHMTVQSGGREMTGANDNWGPPLNLHLKRTTNPPSPVTHDTSIVNGGVGLAVRLYRPNGPGPFPAVVVVPGSGDQGRDNWTYRGWAQHLARRGIAAVVYDKRGVGGSGGDYRETDFQTLADDVSEIVDWLAEVIAVDRDRIGLMGISQGGWLSLIAAERNREVDFIILNVGPSVSVWQQERHRVEYMMRRDSIAPSAVDTALAYTDTMFACVGAPDGYERLRTLREYCATAPWGGYLSLPESQEELDLWRLEKFDPAPILSTFTRPLLALYAEHDVLVPPDKNVNPLRQHLTAAGNREFDIAVFPDVGHNLELRGTLVNGTWEWPDGFWRWPRRAPDVFERIAGWIDDLKRGP